MPTSRLENEQGQWLREARLAAHDWEPGNRIPRGLDPLEVIDVRAGRGDELVTLLVRGGLDVVERATIA